MTDSSSHPRSPSRAPIWVQLAVLPLLFLLGARLSLASAVSMPEVLVILWLPNGLLLAGLLHYGGRRYGYFAALVVLAEILADHGTFSLVEAVLFGAINLLEVSVAYLLLRRWRFDPRFAAPADITKFVVAGPVIAASMSSLAAAASSHFRGTETSFVEFFRVWWFSDGLGLLIVTPLVLSFWPPRPALPETPVAPRWYDWLALVPALAVGVAVALSDRRMLYGLTIRASLLIPPALYVAMRFGVRVTTAVVAVIAALVLFVTRNGQQPFGELPVRETVISAQELIFIVSTMSLGIAALLSQHRRNALDLEGRVKERTAALTAANEQLEKLAVTDPLTGTLNRRALFNVLEREWTRCRRYNHPVAVIVFDVDHFKEINDRLGHAAGDAVLREVAALGRRVIRTSDAIARYGGEEFVIVAGETDGGSAVRLAERLRDELSATQLTVDHEVVRVTASFGVAACRADDGTAEQLLRRADQALYLAKAGGRDRVHVAS